MSKNYNQPEGPHYQASIKTESDTLLSPQANARLNTYESQNNTQTAPNRRTRKPSGNYKEYANTNEPMKSQPPVQPKIIEPAGIYSLQNSPVNYRSPFRNAEEAFIKETYHNTLNQSNSFHKQASCFTEFTGRNKGRMAEYRTDKSPGNGHSRYISKPVFFTTLKSKNKLSELATQDHSELLEEVTRQTFTKSFRPGNTHSRFINEDSLNNNTNTNDSKNESKPDNKNQLLPNITKIKRRNLSHIFTTEGNCTPIHGSPATTQTKLKLKSRSPGVNDPNLTKTTNNFYTCTSFASKSMKHTLSVFDKPRKPRPTRKEEFLARLKNTQDLKNVSKYHTKDMAEVLMEELTEHSKIGPEEYLEHDKNVENFRDATMTANIKKQEIKFIRDHSGSPKPYFEIRKKEKYRESGAIEDIGQFEENLRGWMKSVPNFGKQRWTYVKDWEYKLA